MNILAELIHACILVTAVAVDVFVCSFAYGTNKIKIPFSSVTMINFVSSLLLAMGLLFGRMVGNFLPVNLTTWISFSILILLGITKLFDSLIKKIIKKYNGIDKNLKFSIFNLGIVINLYANPEEADRDRSKILTPKEAIPLGIAVGIDAMTAGFGAGIVAANLMMMIGVSLIINTVAVMLGRFLGNKVVEKTSLDFSWLSGVILIGIAIVQLI